MQKVRTDGQAGGYCDRHEKENDCILFVPIMLYNIYIENMLCRACKILEKSLIYSGILLKKNYIWNVFCKVLVL